MADFLILHGWGGNKPAHWQEWLAGELTAAGHTAHAPKMADPTNPDPAVWMALIHEALGVMPEDTDLTVLTHSMGAVNWMRHAAMSQDAGFVRPGSVAARALLVAPPYVVPEIPPLDLAATAAFFPPVLSPAGLKAVGRGTVSIAPDNDPLIRTVIRHGTSPAAYAAGLGLEAQKLPGSGQVSPCCGYGKPAAAAEPVPNP
jgi:predicted alpha/beta hydrolase family esterase